MKHYLTTTALLLAALAQPAFAQDDNYSAAYKRCMDKSGGVTSGMVECTGNEITLQDARLNKNYKTAMAALEAPQKTLLRDAQRLWVQYRDANCGMYAQLTGGTMDRIVSADCVMSMTKQRADDLEGLTGML
jgi:uncharacterized protein YecT (DUF1311 family)